MTPLARVRRIYTEFRTRLVPEKGSKSLFAQSGEAVMTFGTRKTGPDRCTGESSRFRIETFDS